MNGINRFLGGPPLTVLFRLLVISFVVGLILSTLGLRPGDIYERTIRLIEHIWSLGFDAFDMIFDYLLIGAAIVIPIWVILRILNLGKHR